MPPDINWLALFVIPAALLVVNIVIGALVSVLLWQAKDFRHWIRTRIGEQDDKIERVNEALHTLKESLPREYVLRGDFDHKIDLIREDVVGVMTTVDRKLDAIGRALTAHPPERGA